MVKGEAFLLASLIIVVGLVFMYLPMRREYLIKEENILKKEYEEKIFENLLNELKNTVYISYENFDLCIENTYTFLNFTKKYLSSKGLDFFGLVLVGDISSSLNFTGINFFDEKIDINITLNSLDSKIILIDKYSINTTSFSLTEENNEISIEYENVKKRFNVSGKTILYLDLKIEGIEYLKRYVDIFVYN